MNSQFINNLYLVWFNPDEFPYFYEDYKSRWKEFLVAVFASFSLSVSMQYLSVASNKDFGLMIGFGFILNTYFFNLIPSFLTGIIEFEVHQSGGQGDIHRMISFVRYSLSLFFLSTPIAIILSIFGITGFLGTSLVLFLTILIILFNISRGATAIYRMDSNRMFRIVFSSYIKSLTLPQLLIIYYFSILIGIVL